MADPKPVSLRIGGRGPVLAGEEVAPFGGADGEAPRDPGTVVLLHGLTASRRYVVHGSRLLARRGFRMVSYDARGHGESDPAPAAGGYAYDELVADLERVLEVVSPDRRVVLAGHSMGSHTVAAHALEHPERIAAVVLIGPASTGTPLDEDLLAHWDALADGLERGGPEGFAEAYDADLDPEWRETLLRITRDRLGRHLHPEAVAQALREVPRSMPFDGLGELEFLELPALVVASHDEADPGHPYDVAAAWAQRLPQARLVSEPEGHSPLAWQGGRLSREIAAFCEEDAVADRLSG